MSKERNMSQIITSLLSEDAYKFSMGQAIYHQFSEYKTTWTFKCRNKDVHFTKEMVEEIKRQVKLFCSLRFTEDELSYLDKIRWIKGSYVDFLRLWHARFEDFTIDDNAECGLNIEASGTWLNTSMYEIPILAIVNEVYFRFAYDEEELTSTDKNGNEKKEIRTVMRLHPALAPYKAAVLPLVKKLTPKAEEVFEMLSKKFMVTFDETGTIGKRYRRQDEIGTPMCITYDFDTLEKDGCVTVRDRDTMEQERVKIEDLVAYIEKKIEY